MMHSGAGGSLRENTKTGGFLLQRAVDASRRERLAGERGFAGDEGRRVFRGYSF